MKKIFALSLAVAFATLFCSVAMAEPLVKVDNGKPVPAMAASWSKVNDTTFKFVLKDDNAEAVKKQLEEKLGGKATVKMLDAKTLEIAGLKEDAVYSTLAAIDLKVEAASKDDVAVGEGGAIALDVPDGSASFRARKKSSFGDKKDEKKGEALAKETKDVLVGKDKKDDKDKKDEKKGTDLKPEGTPKEATGLQQAKPIDKTDEKPKELKDGVVKAGDKVVEKKDEKAVEKKEEAKDGKLVDKKEEKHVIPGTVTDAIKKEEEKNKDKGKKIIKVGEKEAPTGLTDKPLSSLKGKVVSVTKGNFPEVTIEVVVFKVTKDLSAINGKRVKIKVEFGKADLTDAAFQNNLGANYLRLNDQIEAEITGKDGDVYKTNKIVRVR